MSQKKQLDRNSPTEKLLKRATELGYRDREGLDNSPSWMSQELDQRLFKQSQLNKQPL